MAAAMHSESKRVQQDTSARAAHTQSRKAGGGGGLTARPMNEAPNRATARPSGHAFDRLPGSSETGSQ